ncbi:MAG: DNA internalization-related competence protein ComEC/Rec2 [Acidobacteria bacterium]|nr:DNA internalization-related competence protein ComEC/Rec2 [Acidobacteriota bacterium]
MPSIGLLPALALLGGAACGMWSACPSAAFEWMLVPLVLAGWLCHLGAHARPRWQPHLDGWTLVALVAGFLCAGWMLAAAAADAALRTPLRDLLDRQFGGFALDTLGPGGRHGPLAVRARLLEDATGGGDARSLRARILAVRLSGEWQAAGGDVGLSIGGLAAPQHGSEWIAGREVELPVTFRRPARYLNEGVPDFERQLALDGTTLFGSAKSGLLVEVRSRGDRVQEAAGRVRAHVRRSLERWVAPHDPVSAAIVTAVLIGDRTGLPDEVRLRLQAAGTYHVVAISGGNIAIFAGLTLLALAVCGVSGRPAAVVTIVVLLAYAQIVKTEPSVWRATLMAVLYLAARLMDHRSPVWHTMAIVAAVLVCARPLDVRDVGFILTFGATAALIEGARRASRLVVGRRWAAWVLASVAASLAVEVALLPVSASAFSRVTSAGLVLNLLAVPLMGVVQAGGMVAASLDHVEAIAQAAGWIAHVAASALVWSARLVDVAPWLTARVPPPPVALIVIYYVALGLVLAARGAARVCGVLIVVMTAVAIATGFRPHAWIAGSREVGTHGSPPLHVTVFDVGQGDAALLQLPDRSSILVDVGGSPFGRGSFDIGARVLAPALWARGVGSLDTFVLTHADPDHIGGGRSILTDFAPRQVWEGVPVPRHVALQELLRMAHGSGARVEQRTAGDEVVLGGARLRVLHPPAPDWERQRVRNDDSVVLEVVYGEVAMLLAGDVGAAIERAILPRLTPARVRILKVAHHGSRTSTSRELLEGWRPRIAVISCGRGNTFGHPAPEVIQRLEAIGAAIYRTDLRGQITIETDGSNVAVRTFLATKSTTE